MAKSGVSMKCRLPADAWPATPGRKPCSPSSAWRSRPHSAIRAGGTQTSSMISDVPGRAQAADQPVHPLAHASRTPRSRSASRVKSGGADQLVAGEDLARRRAASASSSPSSSAPNSTSSAADSGGSSASSSGVPGDVLGGGDQRRGDHQLDRASRRRRRASGTGAVAASMPSKWSQAIVVRGRQRHGLEDRLGDEARACPRSRRAGGGRSRAASSASRNAQSR